MEKGMLAELNALVEELGTEVFENLITAFAKEDRIYAVPGQVRLPVVMGRADAVSGITGLRIWRTGSKRCAGNCRIRI